MKLIIRNNVELLALVQRISPLVTEVELLSSENSYITPYMWTLWKGGRQIDAIKALRNAVPGLAVHEAKDMFEKERSK